MTEQLKLTEAESIALEHCDNKLEFIALTDTLTDLRFALEQMSSMGGVTQAMAKPYENALPENVLLASFTKLPSQTNIAEFTATMEELTTSTLDSLIVNINKSLKFFIDFNTMRDITFDFSFLKEAYVVGSDAVPALVEKYNKDYKYDYSRFSEMTLLSPGSELKEIMDNGEFIYGEVLNRIIGFLEAFNAIANDTTADFDVAKLNLLLNEINALYGSVIDKFSIVPNRGEFLTSTPNDILTLGDLINSFIDEAKSADPIEEFEITRVDHAIEDASFETGIYKSTTTPLIHLDMSIQRRTRSIEKELSKLGVASTTLFNIGELHKVEALGGVEKFLIAITNGIEFIYGYTKSRDVILKEELLFGNVLQAYKDETKKANQVV